MSNETDEFLASEVRLEDDYPVYCGYWYLADGKPVQCELYGEPQADVFELRISLNASEIRRCDAVARGLLTF